MKILPYAAGFIVLFLLAFALYVRSVPVKEPKAKLNVTSYADLEQTPYDAVPPDAESAGIGVADTAKSVEAEPSLSSEQSSGDAGTIEL
jgi:hypothetical protein